MSPTRPSLPTDPIKPSAYLKWWVCVLLLLASALNYMDRQTLSQTGKRITDYFHLSHEQFGSLEGAFNAAFAIAVFVVGWMADRWNIRVAYPTIVVLWSLAGFATGFAESFMMLLACRFALGLFEAGNIPFGVLTVKRILRPEERALGNGMFQSGSALGAIITPWVVLACVWALNESGNEDVGMAWRLPFRVVGAAGIVWAVLWLLTVKSRHVAAPPAPVVTDTYWAIWRNRRFWVSLIVVVSINSAWRSFGFWLPKLLQEGKGYGENETAPITSGFFAAADAGSLAVGAAVLWLARRGMTLPRARLICFTGCTGLTAIALVVATLPRGWELIAALLLLGFGALGLFPIYYALSQEISSRHQGKVTGTLSCLNAAYLALLFPLQGKLIDYLGSFSVALGVAGLFPIVGLFALAFGWKDAPTASPHLARQSSDTAS
ncbi:MAG TPA: MFS transporter [Gemmataceae bacterium]|nr:MFS transporter [Gemmataceae bacterium]